jgi:hypothetical protein
MRRLLKTGRLGLLLACGFAAGSLAFASSALADTTISTLGSWNGSSFIYPFGTPDTKTYGQTITAPSTDTVLQSFTFEMRLPTSLAFRGEVYAWDAVDQHPSGKALWQSAAMSTTDSSVFQAITFSTGGVELTAGNEYVLFATVAKDRNPKDTGGDWGHIGSSVYAGGAFVFANTHSFGKLLHLTWDVRDYDDLAFSASFTTPLSG